MEDFNRIEVHSIECPNCRKTVFVPAISGTQSVICSSCLSTYPASFWSVSEKEVSPSKNSGHLYNLRVRSDSIECLNFESKFGDLSLLSGDRLLVVGKLNRPEFIQNLTANWTHFSKFPRRIVWFNNALVIILFTVFGYLYLGMYIYGVMPVILSLAWVKLKFFAGKAKKISDRQQSSLANQQQQFAVLYELGKKESKISFEQRKVSELQTRLSSLSDSCAEMKFSSDDVEILNRARRQVAVHRNALSSMAKSCERLINLIWMDIELEKISDSLPSHTLLDYWQETEQLEEQLQSQLMLMTSTTNLKVLKNV